MIRRQASLIINTSGSRVEKFMFTQLKALVNQWRLVPSDIGKNTPIPQFDQVDVQNLLMTGTKIFRGMGPFIQKEPSAIIVGDLHGNVINLLQILAVHGLPPEQNYVFLGNYINFGEFSIEVFLFVLTLLINFPENVVMLRAECEYIVQDCPRSLFQNLAEEYENPKLIDSFKNAFSFMPLACLIGGKVLCCNSSTPCTYYTLDDIKFKELPIPCFNDNSEMFKAGLVSVMPSDDVFENFLESNNLDYIIVGGDTGNSGVNQLLDGKCLTISSDAWMGSAAVVHIGGDGIPLFVVFTPDSMLLRKDCRFTKIPRISGGVSSQPNLAATARSSAHLQRIRPVSVHPVVSSRASTSGISRVSRLPALSPQPKLNH